MNLSKNPKNLFTLNNLCLLPVNNYIVIFFNCDNINFIDGRDVIMNSLKK